MILVQIAPGGKWHLRLPPCGLLAEHPGRTDCGRSFDLNAAQVAFRDRDFLDKQEVLRVCARCLPVIERIWGKP